LFTPKDEPLILAVMNAVIALAGIEVTRIEIAWHRNLHRTAVIHKPKEPMKGLCEFKRSAAIHDRMVSGRVGRGVFLQMRQFGGHHARHHDALLGIVNALRCAPTALRPSGIDAACARRGVQPLRDGRPSAIVGRRVMSAAGERTGTGIFAGAGHRRS
jgi:hypothetical protein